MIRRMAFGLSLLVAFALPVQAQQGSPTPRRVPVTLALVEQLPQGGDAPFVILRRADQEPRDVILLRSDADSDRLSEAVQALLIARQQGGDTADTDRVLRIRRQQGRRVRPLPWAARVLQDLRAAPRRAVGGVGTVPAVVIWLPRQGRAHAATH